MSVGLRRSLTVLFCGLVVFMLLARPGDVADALEWAGSLVVEALAALAQLVGGWFT
jgi:hypothetical protein